MKVKKHYGPSHLTASISGFKKKFFPCFSAVIWRNNYTPKMKYDILSFRSIKPCQPLFTVHRGTSEINIKPKYIISNRFFDSEIVLNNLVPRALAVFYCWARALASTADQNIISPHNRCYFLRFSGQRR